VRKGQIQNFCNGFFYGKKLKAPEVCRLNSSV